MDGAPLRIVSVGECTMDHYLDLRRDYVGGISLNFAVQSKRAGAEQASLVSRIGTDFAPRILQKLQAENIDTSHVTVQQGSTARQNITIGPSGDRIFPHGGYHPGVLQRYLLQESDLEFLKEHDILAAPLFEQIESLFYQVVAVPFDGWRVADFLDLSDYDYDIRVIEQLSNQLQIAFVSGDSWMAERLQPVSQVTDCIIVVTLGSEGSVAMVGGEPLYEPAMQVENVLDTTGCGDAFQAAFTVSYWRFRDLQKALAAGATQAAKVAQHYGTVGES